MKSPPMDVGPKIRAYRKRRGLSLNEVSRLTGIAASTLSAIELDKSSPTLATLTKIASVFHMKVGAFVDETLYMKAVLCRAGEGQSKESREQGMTARSLTHGLLLNYMQAEIVELEEGPGPLLPAGTMSDRFIYCIGGECTATVDRESYLLRKGDSLYVVAESGLTLQSGVARAIMLVVTANDSARPFP
jgi:transcriptional regulator with XRE-family HTH domain